MRALKHDQGPETALSSAPRARADSEALLSRMRQRAIQTYRGRVALSKLLLAVGVNRGDSVAIQAYTCRAVTDALRAIDATPKFIDLDKTGVNLDPAQLATQLRSGVKAVVLQHTFGIPADLDEICRLCRSYGVALIEDCCHSLFSTYNGELIGTFGEGAFYSFEWGKPVVAGLGGLAIANSDNCLRALHKMMLQSAAPSLVREFKNLIQLIAFRTFFTPQRYWKIKRIFNSLSRHGLVVGSYSSGSVAENPEYRLKISKITSLLINSGIVAHFNDLQRRRDLVDYYKHNLRASKFPALTTPHNAETVYLRYPILVQDKPALLAQAEEQGVEIAGWFSSPIHPFSPAQLSREGYQSEQCPNAEVRCAHLVSLPLHAGVTAKVCDQILKFLETRI